jgi:adenosylcobinamide-GDP ribazoletransferase
VTQAGGGASPPRLLAEWAAEVWTALGFLTVLPTPAVAYVPERLGRAGRWFPAVGLVIGLLLAGVQTLALGWFDPWLAGLLVAVAWAILTGGLHLDGLADCCDGLLAPVARERRLEILRDPRVGTFGAVGLILALGLKAAAVVSVPWTALLLAPVWGRFLLLVTAWAPAARPGGMGAAFAAGLTPRTLAFAALLPVALLALPVAPLRAVSAALLAGLTTAALLRLARARLGGVTGDVYGLTVEVVELVVLLTYAAKS